METREWCRGMEPAAVLGWFDALSCIPRGSGNLEKVSDAVLSWLREMGLRAVKDEWCNVKAFKDASPGCENRPTILLTAHLDMVCAKEDDSAHDFLTDPIPVYVEADGDTITADGTTLGADDGMGAAMILALLADESLVQGPIEAVFTADEETDMSGALHLDYSDLKAELVVNFDGDPIGVAGAGELDTRALLPFAAEEAPRGRDFFTLTVSGLQGGHSGMEATKERGNAVVLLARTLGELGKETDFRLAQIRGGNESSTAFACRASAVIAAEEKALDAVVSRMQAVFSEEMKGRDEGVTLRAERCAAVERVVKAADTARLLDFLLLVPDGVQSRNMELPALMESSVNTGVVWMEDGAFVVLSTIRSGVESRKYALYERVQRLAALVGAALSVDNDLPPWPRRLSPALEALCREIFPDRPIVIEEATNECGIFAANLPKASVVSLQCPYEGAHSTNERISLKNIGLSYARIREFIQRAGT